MKPENPYAPTNAALLRDEERGGANAALPTTGWMASIFWALVAGPAVAVCAGASGSAALGLYFQLIVVAGSQFAEGVMAMAIFAAILGGITGFVAGLGAGFVIGLLKVVRRAITQRAIRNWCMALSGILGLLAGILACFILMNMYSSGASIPSMGKPELRPWLLFVGGPIVTVGFGIGGGWALFHCYRFLLDFHQRRIAPRLTFRSKS